MSALDTQIGGDHYKDMPIQPMEFSMANGLDACQHTIIKYVTRFREKGGVQDLEKAKHVIDMLIEFEKEPAGDKISHDEALNQFIYRFVNDESVPTPEPKRKDTGCGACDQEAMLRKIRSVFPDADIRILFSSEPEAD